MQQWLKTTISVLLGFMICTILTALLLFFFNEKRVNETLQDQISHAKMQIAVLETNLQKINEIDKIKDDSYQKILDISLKNIDSRILRVEDYYKTQSIKNDNAVERRLLLTLSTIITLQKKAIKGENIEKDIQNLITITLFDKNLNVIVKNVSDIKMIKTESDIISNYITVARRLSSEYYKSKGSYVKAFFAKHFYVSNSNGKFYKIGTLINNKDFKTAKKIIDEYLKNVECNEAKEYSDELQNYILINETLEQINHYIIEQFAAN